MVSNQLCNAVDCSVPSIASITDANVSSVDDSEPYQQISPLPLQPAYDLKHLLYGLCSLLISLLLLFKTLQRHVQAVGEPVEAFTVVPLLPHILGLLRDPMGYPKKLRHVYISLSFYFLVL
jgi:hypothetical protein